MKIKIYLSILLLTSYTSFGQIPEEALRLSWIVPNGTARNQAIGGAMGSLGGDLTANISNPAGLGFYNTSDIVITPGWKFGKDKGQFRGTSANADRYKAFNLGTSGFVLGGLGTIGFSVTRVADFSNNSFYKGQNNYSSFAEPLADEFSASNQTIDQALNNPNISLQTKMALYTYLVDTARVNGNLQVIARSENASNRDQQNTIETTGGITELTFGFGGGITRDKKVLLGASLGIPIIRLDRNSYYRESDATGNADNDFSFLTYREDLSIRGVGGIIRAGVIVRPKDYIRLGLAVHSPTWMLLKEETSSGLSADLEQLFAPSSGYDSVGSSVFTGGIIENKYSLNTPTRIMISGSYVFREVEDIRNQKGFITADIEYVNYKWMKFGPYNEENPDTQSFEPYNSAIDFIYKGAFNFRIGGELKFKTIMARAGFSYYGSPYSQAETKGRKMNISGGLGYRHKGMFIDLTYVHRINKDVNFPYRVNSPRANTFATLKESGGNVLLTLGIKI